MSSQSRLGSALEVVAGTAIGFAVSFCLGRVIYPLYGFHATMTDNLELTAWFTVASIVRGYIVRRAFNWFGVKWYQFTSCALGCYRSVARRLISDDVH
jgi:hypothetical protein